MSFRTDFTRAVSLNCAVAGFSVFCLAHSSIHPHHCTQALLGRRLFGDRSAGRQYQLKNDIMYVQAGRGNEISQAHRKHLRAESDNLRIQVWMYSFRQHPPGTHVSPHCVFLPLSPCTAVHVNALVDHNLLLLVYCLHPALCLKVLIASPFRLVILSESKSKLHMGCLSAR